jgi:hypothetical protein
MFARWRMTIGKRLPPREGERKRQPRKMLTSSPADWPSYGGEGRNAGEPIIHKQKFVLLLLFASLLTGCVSTQRTSSSAPRTKAIDLPPLTEQRQQSLLAAAKSITVEFPEPWTEKSVTVFQSVGAPITIKASRTVAKVKHGTAIQDWPQLAFVCPRSGNTWIGPECPLYVETSTGLYGLKVTDRLEWHACGVVKEYSFKLPLFDDLLLRYLGEAPHFFVRAERPDFYYDLQILGADFFKAAQGKSCLHVSKASLSVGILELELMNTCAKTQATVWFDVQARELIHCQRDGRELFP